MGQCDCWGRRKKKTSYHPFIYDEEYLEFNAEEQNNNVSTYRPPPITPTPQPTETELPAATDSNTQPTNKAEQRPASVDENTPRQYTQYTESAFLSRPNPPSNSLILNSMMVDSSVLAPPPSSSPSSRVILSQSRANPTVEDSTTLPQALDNTQNVNDSITSYSSVYYDSSSTSFISSSVTEGAFEPSPSDPK